jgi:hypothetical protein
MADLKQCEFYLLRYVPDVVKDEFVNLGVVLLETSDGDSAFTDVRFTRDWRRVRCLDPEADVELLESFEGELRRLLQSRAHEAINYRPAMSRRDWLLHLIEDSFSNVLQLTPGKAVLTESPPEELGKLVQMYLEPAVRGRRAQSGRRVLFNALRGAFEQQGVWALMRTQIAASQYTHRGDPLKIDCGYRPNGVIRMFHTVSLESDIDAAKVLAFSYPALREGLAKAENATTDLTAVVEDNLNRNDEAIAFALATLASSQIQVAAISEMPRLAERARRELRL